MIRYDSFCIAGRHLRERRCLPGIRKKVLWPSECGLEKAHVADAFRPSKQHQNFFMHGKNDVLPDPDGFFHSASL